MKLRVVPKIGMTTRMILLEPALECLPRQRLNTQVQCILHIHTWTQSLARDPQVTPAINRSDLPSLGGSQPRICLTVIKHLSMALRLTHHPVASSSRRHSVHRLLNHTNKGLTCSNLLRCSHHLNINMVSLHHRRPYR